MNYKRQSVNLRWLHAAFLCAALTAQADVTVGMGETLSITNAEDIGFTDIYLDAGATLALSGTGVAFAGLNAYQRAATWLGAPYKSPYGASTQIATNLYWAENVFTATFAEYIYTGRWYVPEDGVYSFYEHMDDGATIAIDGDVVLYDVVYNVENCARDVSLAAGWHALEVRVYNGSSQGGPASGLLKSGILYSPDNDLISVTNQRNAFAFVDPGDGSVLRPAHNARLFQKMFVDGDVSFDLSEYGLATPLVLSGGLLPQPTSTWGAVTITGGVGEARFGCGGNEIDFPTFNLDMRFSGLDEPAGLTFIDQSTVVTWPTSCLWRVEDNATVALAGAELLGPGDVYLTNHNIYVLSEAAIADEATVHVRGTNLSVALKPCFITDQGFWHGIKKTFTNDVALEGVNSTVKFPLAIDFYLQGNICGTGTVRKTGGGRVEILEECDFIGQVICSDGKLIFDSEVAGNSNNVVRLGVKNSTIALYPPGYGVTETTTWIRRVEGLSLESRVYVPGKQTLVIDYVDGMLTLEGLNLSNSVARINTLGTNATIRASHDIKVEIDTISPGASIIMERESTALKINGAGNTLEKLIVQADAVEVSGGFDVTFLEGAGSLIKNDDTTLGVGLCSLSGDIFVNAGTLLNQESLFATNNLLGDLPSLWLDAATPDVFTQYESFTYTNDFKVIAKWDDCRPHASGYAEQTRGEGHWQTYPYLMTSALNGMSVISMGSHQITLSSAYENRKEARRMPLDYTRTPKYAIMVFGSQNGGGAAVLGGEEKSANSFARGGSDEAHYRAPSTAILANSEIDVWADGFKVAATTTGFNGGYQILTVKTDDLPVATLGWDNQYYNAGGQNYAEVLFYTNELSSVERIVIENYLARKWNLPYPAYVFPTVRVAEGATFEASGSCVVKNLTGAGNLAVSDSATVCLGGIFSGNLQLNGGNVSIKNKNRIPGAEVVPLNNLSLWIDPCVTNRVVLGGEFTPTRPLTIAGIFDRTTDDRYLLGTYAKEWDRRPWLSVTNGPLGNVLHWIDYENIYEGDLKGNTLRLQTDPQHIGGSHTLTVPADVRSGFIALDSLRGGGAPILNDVQNSKVIKRDNPQSVSSPIWGSITTDSLKSGATYLDGKAVNGATQGYSGRNELLSFVATNQFQAAYFGYYGHDSVEKPNCERLGEIILFDCEVDEAVRVDIEAYLMKKWLGKARDGYVDITESTLSGSGTISVEQPKMLPLFATGFAGGVSLSGSEYEYTVGGNELDGYEITPAAAIPGVLSVPAAGKFTVNFDVAPRGGSYPLMTFGSITGEGFGSWSLATRGAIPTGLIKLEQTDTAVILRVIPMGTLFLLR